MWFGFGSGGFSGGVFVVLGVNCNWEVARISGWGVEGKSRMDRQVVGVRQLADRVATTDVVSSICTLRSLLHAACFVANIGHGVAHTQPTTHPLLDASTVASR